MQQDLTIARTMLPHLSAESASRLLDTPQLRLAEAGPIRVCYAPFDHIARDARLVVVGITPGMTQAVNALQAARAAQLRGLPLPEVLEEAKRTASFSGRAIRANLVAMLDAIGVAKRFGMPSTDALFRPGSGDVHFTSALRYPVFVNGKNYSGTPNMLSVPILRAMIETHLAEEAALLPGALWLPLGPKADAAVSHLVRQDRIAADRVLSGMPHPSGANAERVAVFLGRKDPSLASRQTNPGPLLSAYGRLRTQLNGIAGATI